MVVIDSSFKLFESLLEFELNNKYVDLHNDYVLSKMTSEGDNNLNFVFNSDSGENEIEVTFLNAIIDVGFINDELPDNLIIDNFHRGRFENEDGLHDLYEGKMCFYVQFANDPNQDFDMEIRCSSVEIR